LEEEVRFRRAELLFLSGDFEASASEFKELVKRYPRGLRVNDAIELGLIIRDGSDAMLWSLNRYAAAQLALRQGQEDTALGLFAVLASDSAGALADDAQFAAAGVYVEAGDISSAIESYEVMIARFPESALVPRAWMAIGNLYADELADAASARPIYQKILSDFRESPVAEAARHRLQRLDMP
jgi:TolA-binding protein